MLIKCHVGGLIINLYLRPCSVGVDWARELFQLMNPIQIIESFQPGTIPGTDLNEPLDFPPKKNIVACTSTDLGPVRLSYFSSMEQCFSLTIFQHKYQYKPNVSISELDD